MNESANFSKFEEQVRERAYALWEREGRPCGRDAEHWRASEQATRAEQAAPAPAKKAVKPAPRKKPSALQRAQAAAAVATTH